MTAKEAQFDVMQRHGGVIVCGSTYVLRPRTKNVADRELVTARWAG